MHGTCRDIEVIRESRCPVYAKGVCPRRSRNDFIFGNKWTNYSNWSKIKKNDIDVTDQSGAVCMLNELIKETLSLLKRISKQENLLEDQVLNNEV